MLRGSAVLGSVVTRVKFCAAGGGDAVGVGGRVGTREVEEDRL